MECLKCGSSLSVNAKFCGKCGEAAAPAPAPAPAPVALAVDLAELNTVQACPQCSTDCKVGAKFCGKCGHAFVLGRDEAAEAETVSEDVHSPASVNEDQTEDQTDPVEASTSSPPRMASASQPKEAVSSASLLKALGCVAVLLLVVFAWWLNSRTSVPDHNEPAVVEPSALDASEVHPIEPRQKVAPGTEADAGSEHDAVQSAASVGAVEIVESESPSSIASRRAEIEAEAAAEVEARRLQAQAAARQEQDRREARQRAQDKAKLNEANKTLDDLLN